MFQKFGHEIFNETYSKSVCTLLVSNNLECLRKIVDLFSHQLLYLKEFKRLEQLLNNLRISFYFVGLVQFAKE